MQKFFKGMYRNKISVTVLIVSILQMSSFTGFAQIDDNHGKIRTIVIDAGHGGKDSGARGKNSNEKDIVLDVALLAGKYIEEKFPDVNVIYTRKTDVFIPLHERSKIANDANADLFISIHANANPNPKAYGSETYALGLHKTKENLEVAKKENAVIVFEENYESKYEGFDPNDVQSYIMMSVMTDIYLEQSLHAASFVQTQFRDRVRRKDRGVKQAGFLVLWETGMPSILIELGFVSNPTEEKFLLSEQGQDYLASAIYRAFKEYKVYIESGSVSSEQFAGEITTPSPQTEPVEETDTDPSPTPVEPAIIVASTNTSAPIDSEPTTSEIKKSNAIKYKVQILYSANPINLDDQTFKDFNDVEEISVNGKYKYLVGAKDNYNEAVEYSKWVKSRHPDAFIVAVLDGKIIPLSEALELTKNKTN